MWIYVMSVLLWWTCSLHNHKIRPRKWRCHSSMMLFQLPLLTKREVWEINVTLPRVKLEPSMATDGFPCNVSLCLISPEETLLKFKKKIQKVGVSNRFGWTTKQTFQRLEQRHSWPCQIKPNHTSKSSHPIFEHLKIWKKKTWFLEFWFHIKLARPSTGWFQGSPPWSRCHIYPRPPQTRQTFSSCSQKKKIWIFEEAKVLRDFLRLPSSGTVDEM